MYGANYIEVVFKLLLNNSKISIKYLLKVLYENQNFSVELIDKFKSEFNFTFYEYNVLFQ